jgi:hypothetical protein
MEVVLVTKAHGTGMHNILPANKNQLTARANKTPPKASAKVGRAAFSALSDGNAASALKGDVSEGAAETGAPRVERGRPERPNRTTAEEMTGAISKMKADMEKLQKDMEAAKEAAKAAAEYWRNQLLAMKIAIRIIKGDDVPQVDYNFLQEHNQSLFSLALSLRNPDPEDPEEHEALSEDGDKNKTIAESVLGTDAFSAVKAAISAPAPSASTPAPSPEVSY